MQRVDRDSPSAQSMRQFLGIQRRGELRLSIKCERLIKLMTVQIVEHDAFCRRLIDACAAAYDNDASAAVAYDVQQLIHQGEVTDMVDEELQLNAIARSQCRWVGNAGIGDDCIEWHSQSTDRRS